MDNKKCYKRLSTCFWFILATFVLWFPIISAIFSCLLHFDNNTTFNNSDYRDVFFSFMNKSYTQICIDNTLPIPQFIVDLFFNLGDLLGIEDLGQDIFILDWLFYGISWFTWVYFVELLVDFIVWLPRWFHKLLDKVGD